MPYADLQDLIFWSLDDQASITQIMFLLFFIKHHFWYQKWSKNNRLCFAPISAPAYQTIFIQNKLALIASASGLQTILDND